MLGLLVLFLTDHRGNVKDFVDNDGVSMLEYILRTAILSFSVEDCDLLVTRICALAKVSSGASGGSSSVQRLGQVAGQVQITITLGSERFVQIDA